MAGLSSLNLGKIVHSVFNNEMDDNFASDIRDFEMLMRSKEDDVLAREYNYYLRAGAGPGAIGYADVGTTSQPFQAAQESTAYEMNAKFKMMNATIELSRQLILAAKNNPKKYADPLVSEIEGKILLFKRRLGADMHLEGLGVLASIASTAGSTTQVVTLQAGTTYRGGVGQMEIDDLVVHKAANGGAGSSVTVSSGTFSYWKITDKSREDDTVTLQAYNTSDAAVNATSWSPTVGEVFYKKGVQTIPDTTSVSDYGTAGDLIVGLESWTADDSRVIHGVTMSGNLKGSRTTNGGAPISFDLVGRALDKAKLRIKAKGKYKTILGTPEAQRALITSNEADRRLVSIEDKVRGVKGKLGFAHDNDVLELVTSEFCHKNRLYMPPEGALEFRGKDIQKVEMPDGQDMFLKPATSTYVNKVQMFLEFAGVLVCRQNAAIAVAHNFTT